jgi:60 kDa SS-A/Ro ribonucleoprotein
MWQTAESPDMQGVKTPGSGETQNRCGAYVHIADLADLIDRFLCCGTAGGTYYVGETQLTQDTVNQVREWCERDPVLVAVRASAISWEGRAYRNDSAIFLVASLLCGSLSARHQGRLAARQVCRTSTHIMQLAEYVRRVNGSLTKAAQKAIAFWYEARDAETLASQHAKYRGGRHGWTHRDLLRQSHPRLPEDLAGFLCGKNPDAQFRAAQILAQAQACTLPSQVVRLAQEFPGELPREYIPSTLAVAPQVQRALVHTRNMRGQALLRNLRSMNATGALDDLSTIGEVARLLVDNRHIRDTRLHPMQYLLALYACGADNGRVPTEYCWEGNAPAGRPLPHRVGEALEEGLYQAFGELPTIPGSLLIGVDTSGSMDALISLGRTKPGVRLPSCRAAAACTAMVLAHQARDCDVLGFDRTCEDIPVSTHDRLGDVMRRMDGWHGGATNPSVLMAYAQKNRVNTTGFVVLTDNETNCYGAVKPMVALRHYRQEADMPRAGLVVVAMTGDRFSLADPADPHTMDVCGFDAGMPATIATFMERSAV